MPRRGRSQRSGKVSLRKGHLPELRARVRVQEEKEGSGISERGTVPERRGEQRKPKGQEAASLAQAARARRTVCVQGDGQEAVKRHERGGESP